MKNDMYQGKRKVKDRLSETEYVVVCQVADGAPAYEVKDEAGNVKTVHHNWLFLLAVLMEAMTALVAGALISEENIARSTLVEHTSFGLDNNSPEGSMDGADNLKSASTTAYLCIARALVFEGSILAYNPVKNEAEWVPARGLANDLTWAEERSTIPLANYVLCIPEEVAWIAGLGTRQLVSCADDCSTSEEEEEAQHHEPPTMDTEHEWEEESEDGARQTDLEEEAEPNRQQCLLDWEAVMGELEKLAYDLRSDFDAMVIGLDCHSTPRVMRSHVCRGH